LPPHKVDSSVMLCSVQDLWWWYHVYFLLCCTPADISWMWKEQKSHYAHYVLIFGLRCSSDGAVWKCFMRGCW